jgi:hypothetical protein
MKPAYLVLAALCMTLACASSSAETNVLSNSDFEMNGGGLRGWKVTAGTTKYSVVSNDPGRRGNCIEGVETEPGGSLGRLLQNLDWKIVPGQTYRLTGWIKTANVASEGGVVIGVGTVNADGALVSGSFNTEIGRVNGTTDWTFFDSGEFVLPRLTPGTTHRAVYLDFNGNGGGMARFDDVSLIGPVPKLLDLVWESLDDTRVRICASVLAIVLTIVCARWAYRKSDWYNRE